MAVLIDCSQVFISGLLSQISANRFRELEEDLVRHIIINTLRSHIKKFKNDYGDAVLCLDSRKYWRKDIFPHYKSHRKESREKSSIDWNLIFKVLNELKEDLKVSFPYKTIEVLGAEADDIIGTLTPRIAASETVLIISEDQDFLQLQKYPNVKQYSPSKGIFIKSVNPRKDLKEKIIRGDAGDFICNILTDIEDFGAGKRQKSITAKNLEVWLDQDPLFDFDPVVYERYKRNQQLIDFDYIPEDLRNNIINEYESTTIPTREKLYKYFVSKRLVALLECIDEF